MGKWRDTPKLRAKSFQSFWCSAHTGWSGRIGWWQYHVMVKSETICDRNLLLSLVRITSYLIYKTEGFRRVTTIVKWVNDSKEVRIGLGTRVIYSYYFCHMLVRSWEISFVILSILFGLWEFLSPIIFRFEVIAAILRPKQKSIYCPATHVIQKYGDKYWKK